MSGDPLRQALEEALLAEPDDVGTHMAYADYLQDRGDPRGEFIRVQLALDGAAEGNERKHLQRRERELLQAHRREWLGDLAPFLLDKNPPVAHDGSSGKEFCCQFRRGWLDFLEMPVCTVALARLLRSHPMARLLKGLAIGWTDDSLDDYEPGPDVPEDTYNAVPLALRGAPFLAGLRLFHYGLPASDEYRVINQIAGGPVDPYDFPFPTNGENVVDLVEHMPRLEELYLLAHDVDTRLYSLPTLTHLRVLQLYHFDPSPVKKLAENPATSRLTHLLIHPHSTWSVPPIRLEDLRALVCSPHLPGLKHLQLRLSDLGDAGVAEIVRSGILARLEVLDLRHGTVTDEGAQLLAACPDLRHLQRLDLQRNRLTAAGVAAFEAVGVSVRLDNQQTPGDHGGYDDFYLYEGDVE